MPYSSSLIDKEWELLEPVLSQLLPPKKRTRPSNWTKRQILDGIFYQLKNGCNWQDLPKDWLCCKNWLWSGKIVFVLTELSHRHPIDEP